jgi:hypothetical protein
MFFVFPTAKNISYYEQATMVSLQKRKILWPEEYV